MLHAKRAPSTTGNQPANTVAPAITGTIGQGNVLTCSTGTWTNTPTGYSYQWYNYNTTTSSSTAVGTNASTYTQAPGDVGLDIYCVVTATNASGSGSALSNTVGPVTGSGLATPTNLTNYSSLSTPPLVMEWSDTDDIVGLYGQLQVDYTSSAFANITQNLVFFIDGQSYAQLAENIGLTTPGGGQQFWMRIRTARDNDAGSTTVTGTDPQGNAVSFPADVSAWSAVFNGTMAGSTAVFDSSGTGKSPYITLSNGNLSWANNSTSLGAQAMDLVSIPSQTTKWQAELSVDGWYASGTWACGLTDGTINFSSPGYSTGANASFPGNTAAGISFQLANGGSALVAIYGNVSHNITLPQAAAIGDRLCLKVDQTTNTIYVYWYTAATTSVSALLSTITITAPTAWYLFGAGYKGTGVDGSGSDSGTLYCSSAALKRPLDTGYGIYG